MLITLLKEHGFINSFDAYLLDFFIPLIWY